MEIEITFKGISSHGCAPERGKNAIYMASGVCLDIEKLNERLAYDEFLGKGSVTISEFVSGSPSYVLLLIMQKSISTEGLPGAKQRKRRWQK